jgi:outer membrane protein assembly factor BamE (lipoprotein component of BamABCDE complex)
MRYWLASAALLLGGCTNIYDGIYNGPSMIVASVNRSSLDKLQVGMTREQAIEVMGEPHLREAYGSREFLIYRTNHREGMADSMTPVAIVDGRVKGWGRNYYDDVRREEIVIKER